MPLQTGSRLGPYEIVSPLGAGGMGEVYKARDTRLERTVAVKVLPSHLSTSPESRQRFEREAKTISQLSHPHICALYDVGREGETEYLVMELLEGETLSDRLAKAALPLEQTLRYGQEIADALDKAHRQGIVHRDLKPGNVMLTKSGVKLLDFGLAKAVAPAQTAGSLTALPTQQGLTQEGTILGTFHYMAPEQLEGKEADGRTDIFALGCVLYEMACGKKAFSGATQASLITAIMSAEPPSISSVQPMSPPALDRAVKKCLAKDPEERWQNAADLGSELKWIGEGSAAGLPAPVAARRRGRERLAWTTAMVASLLAMLALAYAFLRRPEPPIARTIRFQIPLVGASTATGIAISPDGTQLAFIAAVPGSRPSLWVRPLDSLEARPLAGSDGAMMPFWSPDSRQLGFFSEGRLKTIDVAIGVTKTLYAGGDPRGGAWAPDGTIIFAPNFQSPILRVSAQGGAATPVTKLDASGKEQTHRWPSFLPDGRHFLYYTSRGSGEEPGEIFAGSLDGQPPRRIFSSLSLAVFAAPGYLLFDSGRNLVAQPFDPDRLVLSGNAVPIGGPVGKVADIAGLHLISVSRTGLAVFLPATAQQATRLVWFDRSGKELSTLAEGPFYAPRLSHDGSRLAVTRWDPDTTVGDIWLYDLSRNVGSRFTFDPADDSVCAWTPDGRRLIFGSSREGVINLFQARSDRAGSEEPLLRSGVFKEPDDVSPDGRDLIFESIETAANGRIGLWILPLTGGGKPRLFSTGSKLSESAANISPDGRWLAYTSVESGREEVQVSAYPGPGGKWQVSVDGGRTPRWRADGRELIYYRTDGNLMSVEVKPGQDFEVQAPRPLFKVQLGTSPDRQFELSPDGKRILANVVTAPTETPQASVVLNWTAALGKK